MRSSATIAAGVLATLAAAQRPTNTSICDYYTTALLKDNTAKNQATILTLIVNTVVAGNYTKPTIAGVTFPDVMVPGILAKGNVNGTDVNLLPYFDGTLASTNGGGTSGVSMNFLDDGGAAPLFMNMPSNGTSSNQYLLLTHLYQFFGTLLGCTQQGMTGFASYEGVPSMYKVHKFMDLDAAQVGYFISQVGLSAKSFGVADADITAVATALETTFDVKCAAPVTLSPALGSQLQSICIADDCTTAANASCSAYASAVMPSAASSSGAAATGTGSGASPSISEAGAAANSAGVLAAAGLGFFAFLL